MIVTLVADASVLVASVTDYRGYGQWANEMIRADEQLFCPAFVDVECAHGLRRMEFTGDVPSIEAEIALYEILAMDKSLQPFEPFVDRIWELRHNLTCYDAWYVALAETLDCPLVTLDRRIARVGGLNCEVLTAPD